MVKNHDPMTNRTRGLIPLPDGDVPSTTQCILICIPSGEQYKRQLMGGLYEFTHWNGYERDDTHKATLVAQAWRDAIMEGMLNCYQFGYIDGVLNFSNDGGSTWTPVPSSLPGTSGHHAQDDEPLLPARTGSNVACLSAANAVACYVELHRQLSTWYAQAGFILDIYYSIGASLMRFFPWSWSIFGLDKDNAQIALSVLAHSASLNMEALTGTVQEQLTCMLYCNADENGQWDAARYTAVLDEIQAKSGDIWELLYVYLTEVSGIKGLNNAGVTNSVSSYDCAECSCVWCYEFDFTADNGGFSAYVNTGFVPSTLAAYSAAWNSVAVRGVAFPNNRWSYDVIKKTGTVPVIKIEVDVTVNPGNNLSGTDPKMILQDDNGVIVTFNNIETGTISWIGTRSVVNLIVLIEAGFRTDGVNCTATASISAIRIHGTGECPYGEPNCS